MIQKARSPGVRTALLETLESGTTVGYFPEEGLAEMSAKLDAFSQRYAIPRGDLETTWRRYRLRLRVLATTDVPRARYFVASALRDPTDLPFVLLHASTGTDAVCSRDKDIPAAGVPTVDPQILDRIRQLARHQAPRAAFVIVGASVVVVPVASLLAVGVGTVDLFRRAPRWAQVLIGAGALTSVAYPRSRRYLARNVRQAASKLIELASEAAPILVVLQQHAEDGRHSAASVKADIEATGNFDAPTSSAAAFRICARRDTPLTLEQISLDLAIEGLVHEDREALARALHEHPHLERLADGRWRKRAARAPASSAPAP
ncbi:MAG: hypothetical protein RMA76_19065 [Deltaproteobacteria bacterium]